MKMKVKIYVSKGLKLIIRYQFLRSKTQVDKNKIIKTSVKVEW